MLEPATDEAGAAGHAHFVRFGDALKFVIVGGTFPHWQTAGARQVADHAGVELRFMSWDLGRPRPVRKPSGVGEWHAEALDPGAVSDATATDAGS